MVELLSNQVLIVIEIFLVLLGVSAYLFYKLFYLNNSLKQANETLTHKLKDAISRNKGLRVQIKELKQQITDLEKERSSDRENDQAEIAKLLEKNDKMAKQKDTAQEAANFAIKQRNEMKNHVDEVKKELQALKNQQSSQSAQDQTEKNEGENYKEMYHDLKNSIAYSMSGGEQVLDELRNRLEENGNVSASEDLDKFKERYSSLGEMVGLVVDVELFDEDEKESETELKELAAAEDVIGSVEESLLSAQSYSNFDPSTLQFTKEEMDRIVKQLDEVSKIKDRLAGDLEKTSTQLRAFIAKAQMFQAQKEQMRMHKNSQQQLHRNFSKLSSDHREITRKYKNLENRNEILTAQVKNSDQISGQGSEQVEKLNELRKNLETSEASMERLILENEMLEQQFMMMSKDADFELTSSKALERLTDEHKLLESQFFNLLEEFESGDTKTKQVKTENIIPDDAVKLTTNEEVKTENGG
jgi:chromosome segregation ATPase